jgi:DNA-binding transcriptional ArsR family regulator
VANDFVLAPALVNVRFDLAPVANGLQSLRLIKETERLSGMHDWVARTAAALSPARMAINKLIFNAFDPSLYAPKVDTSSFPAFIDGIAGQPAALYIEQLNAELDYMYTTHPDHMERFDRRFTFTELLSDRALFIDFMNKMEECEEDAQWNAAFDLAQNPPEFQRVMVEHLRYMWENHLRAEWERQLPMLNESISAFNRVDFTDKTAVEAARIVTNRDLRDLLEKKHAAHDAVTFVPNPHLGPYVSIYLEADVLKIMFGARLPRGAQSTALSEFSRADLLIRLNALADDARLQILELLTQHDELCAQEIIERLGVSQSTASRHLSQLRATGYIIERRRDVAKCYSLNTDRVVDTLRALTNFLSRQ